MRWKRKTALIAAALLAMPVVADIVFIASLPTVSDVSLTAREAALIEAIVRKNHYGDASRIYFLTPTPRRRWSGGTWQAFPADFHARISNLPHPYRPAREAFLWAHTVRSRRTLRQEWMSWVTVKKWISDTQAEVEVGVWCCPLGGGAGVEIWEFRDGKWKFKSRERRWVS